MRDENPIGLILIAALVLAAMFWAYDWYDRGSQAVEQGPLDNVTLP